MLSARSVVRVGQGHVEVGFDGALGEVLIPVERDASSDLDEGGVARTHCSFRMTIGSWGGTTRDRDGDVEGCHELFRDDLLGFDVVGDPSLRKKRVSRGEGTRREKTYLFVDTSTEVSSSCKVTGTTREQGDVDDATEDLDFCSSRRVSKRRGKGRRKDELA